VVSERKIDLLRKHLGPQGEKVLFADMKDVGTNPGRIIQAWVDFVHDQDGRRLRGIGEPIWPERSAAELVECQRHESLLNVAFAGNASFTLMCPYDRAALDQDVMDEARRSHPFISHPEGPLTSTDFRGTEELAGPFSAALPDPPPSAIEVMFQVSDLGRLRSLVWHQATATGLGEERAGDAVTAVGEIVSNSVRHGGGHGVLRIWPTTDALICEVSDRGRLDQPLVGRYRPGSTALGGRGLWMVNQLCDLVQMRTLPTGTTVRVHIRRPPE
jgi:anti-sigma regulatory factor (Ser/Thr protein kinase)